MATLEKLRQKRGLLVGVILFALLAFILGEVINSERRSGPDTRVGKVNGEVLKYDRYRTMISDMQRNYKDVPYYLIAENVWEGWVQEQVMNGRYQDAGISVGPASVMNGIMKMPEILQTEAFYNPATGQPDPNIVKEWASQMRRGVESGDQQAAQMWMVWEDMKTRSEEMQKANQYGMMIASGLNATKLDAAIENRYQNEKMNGKVAYLPYSAADVQVSDEEIAAYIKKNKDKYQRPDSRDVQYIKIDLAPTQADADAVEQKILGYLEDKIQYNADTDRNDTIAGFARTLEDTIMVRMYTETPGGADKMYHASFEDPEMDQWAKTAKTGDVKGPYRKDNTWNISKISDIRTMPDSVKISHLMISFAGSANPQATRTREAAQSLADSLARVIKAGKPLPELVAQYSDDTQTPDGSLGWMGYTGINELKGIEDIAFGKPKGTVEVTETPAGFHVIKIDDAKPARRAVRVSTITCIINPSKETINNIYTQAHAIATQEATPEQFREKASAAGYSILAAENVTVLAPVIGALGEQQAVTRWLFEKDRKTGDMKIFDIPGAYVIVSVAGMADAGLASVGEVRPEVTNILAKEKQTQVLTDKFNSAKNGNATIEAIAQATGAQLLDVNEVSFSMPIITGIGYAPATVGAMYGIAKDKISSPVADLMGVLVVQQTGKATVNEQADNTHLEASVGARFRGGMDKLYPSLKKEAKIKDNREKIERL